MQSQACYDRVDHCLTLVLYREKLSQGGLVISMSKHTYIEIACNNESQVGCRLFFSHSAKLIIIKTSTPTKIIKKPTFAWSKIKFKIGRRSRDCKEEKKNFETVGLTTLLNCINDFDLHSVFAPVSINIENEK